MQPIDPRIRPLNSRDDEFHTVVEQTRHTIPANSSGSTANSPAPAVSPVAANPLQQQQQSSTTTPRQHHANPTAAAAAHAASAASPAAFAESIRRETFIASATKKPAEIESYVQSDSSSDDEEIRLFLRPTVNLKGDRMVAREEAEKKQQTRSASNSPPPPSGAASGGDGMSLDTTAQQQLDASGISSIANTTSVSSTQQHQHTTNNSRSPPLSKMEQERLERQRRRELEQKKKQAAEDRAASLDTGMRTIAYMLADARYRSRATAEHMLAMEKQKETSVSFLTQFDSEHAASVARSQQQAGGGSAGVVAATSPSPAPTADAGGAFVSSPSAISPPWAATAESPLNQQPLERLLARALQIKSRPDDLALAVIKLHSALQRKKQRTSELHSQIDIIKGQLTQRAAMVENLRGTLWREITHLRTQLAVKMASQQQQQQQQSHQYRQQQQRTHGGGRHHYQTNSPVRGGSQSGGGGSPHAGSLEASPSSARSAAESEQHPPEQQGPTITAPGGGATRSQAQVGLSDETFHMLEIALKKYDNPSDAMNSLLDKSETMATVVGKLLDESAVKTADIKDLRRRSAELARDLATANQKVQTLYKLTGNDLGSVSGGASVMFGRSAAARTALRGGWVLPNIGDESEAAMVQKMLQDALSQNEELSEEVDALRKSLAQFQQQGGEGGEEEEGGGGGGGDDPLQRQDTNNNFSLDGGAVSVLDAATLAAAAASAGDGRKSPASDFSISTHDSADEAARAAEEERLKALEEEEAQAKALLEQQRAEEAEAAAAASSAASSSRRSKPNSLSPTRRGGGRGGGQSKREPKTPLNASLATTTSTLSAAAAGTATSPDASASGKSGGDKIDDAASCADNNSEQEEDNDSNSQQQSMSSSSRLLGASTITNAAAQLESLKQRYQQTLKEKAALATELKQTKGELADTKASQQKSQGEFTVLKMSLEQQIADLQAANKKASRAPQQASDAAMRQQADLKRKLDDALARESETAQRLFELQNSKDEEKNGREEEVQSSAQKQLVDALFETVLHVKRTWYYRETEQFAAMREYFLSSVLGIKKKAGTSIALQADLALTGGGAESNHDKKDSAAPGGKRGGANRNTPAGKRGGAPTSPAPLGKRGKLPPGSSSVKPGSKRGAGIDEKKRRDQEGINNHNNNAAAVGSADDDDGQDDDDGSFDWGAFANSAANKSERGMQTDVVEIMHPMEFEMMKSDADVGRRVKCLETEVLEVQTEVSAGDVEALERQVKQLRENNKQLQSILRNRQQQQQQQDDGDGFGRKTMEKTNEQKELERLAALLVDSPTTRRPGSGGLNDNLGGGDEAVLDNNAKSSPDQQQQQQQQQQQKDTVFLTSSLAAAQSGGGAGGEQQQEHPQDDGGEQQDSRLSPVATSVGGATTTISAGTEGAVSSAVLAHQHQQHGVTAVESEIAAIAASRTYRRRQGQHRGSGSGSGAGATPIVISSATLMPWLAEAQQAATDGGGGVDGTTATHHHHRPSHHMIGGSEAMRVQQMLLMRQQAGAAGSGGGAGGVGFIEGDDNEMSTARLEEMRRLSVRHGSVINPAGGAGGIDPLNMSFGGANASMTGIENYYTNALAVAGGDGGQNSNRGGGGGGSMPFGVAAAPGAEFEPVLCFHRPAQTDPVEFADDPAVEARFERRFKPAGWMKESSFEQFVKKQQEMKEKEKDLKKHEAKQQEQNTPGKEQQQASPMVDARTLHLSSNMEASTSNPHLPALVEKIELAYKELSGAVTSRSAAYRAAVLDRWGFCTATKPAAWIEQRLKAMSEKLLRLAEASLDLALVVGSGDELPAELENRLLAQQQIREGIMQSQASAAAANKSSSTRGGAGDSTDDNKRDLAGGAAATTINSIIAGATAGAEMDRGRVQRMQSIMQWASPSPSTTAAAAAAAAVSLSNDGDINNTNVEPTSSTSIAELQQGLSDQRQRHLQQAQIDVGSEATFGATPPLRVRRHQAMMSYIVDQHKHEAGGGIGGEESGHAPAVSPTPAAPHRTVDSQARMVDARNPPGLEASPVHLVDRHDPFLSAGRAGNRSAVPPLAAHHHHHLSSSSSSPAGIEQAVTVVDRNKNNQQQQPTVSLSAVLNLQALVEGEKAFMNNIPQRISLVQHNNGDDNGGGGGGSSSSPASRSPSRGNSRTPSPNRVASADALNSSSSAAAAAVGPAGSTPPPRLAAADNRGRMSLDFDGSKKNYGLTSVVSNSTTMRMKTLQKLKHQKKW